MKYSFLPKNYSTRLLLGVLMVDAVNFGLIDAQKATTWQLFAGLLLLIATIYSMAKVFTYLLSGPGKRPPRRLAFYLTLISGGLLALQSIGGLGGRDILVLIPLTVVGYFYISYNKSTQKQQA